jgi:predicted N-acetyltransferase YhbS
MEYRDATAEDIAVIAQLHADSWRRNYRGAYSDRFLDGDVFSDRRGVWAERLTNPSAAAHTVVATSEGQVVGFAHTILNHDRTWGALLDNLHVAHELQRQGLGRALMAQSALAVLKRTPASGLYLWVLQQNVRGQAFYEALDGKCVGRQSSQPPGGGTIEGLRYVWIDPSTLLASS